MAKLRTEYPVFLNPTFDELIELCKIPWDTLRILECDEVFLVGSGFGNTHTTLAHVYAETHNFRKIIREHFKFPNNITYRGKWPDWISFIAYKSVNKMLINTAVDMDGNEKCLVRDVPMCNKHIRILIDIAMLSDLETE